MDAIGQEVITAGPRQVSHLLPLTGIQAHGNLLATFPVRIRNGIRVTKRPVADLEYGEQGPRLIRVRLANDN